VTEPINFNKARKALHKQQAKAQAAANRARFGRTKAEKDAEALAAEKARRELEGKKREE
jgi:hypothetical protein